MANLDALNRPFILDEKQTKALKYVGDVYFRMALALVTSAVVGYTVLDSGLLHWCLDNYGRAFSMGIFGTQILTVIAFSHSIYQMKTSMTHFLFALYAIVTGFTFGIVGLIYALDSITTVGVATGVGFTSLVLYGKMTKRDLGPIGTFCLMGLTMLLAFSLIVWAMSFFSVSAAVMSTSLKLQGFIGTLLFAGMTAYESQKLKETAKTLAETAHSDNEIDAFVTAGALRMYMNFVGLFLSLMQVFGRRR